MVSRDWVIIPLGKVVTLQRGYDLPNRLRRLGEVPIITSSGIGGTHSEAMVSGPGVVTGRYGTIGEVFYIESEFWPLNTTLFVRDFHGNDPLFVSYLLRTIDFQTHSGKSGVPGVNRNDLHEVVVALPPTKAEQEAIAEALSNVDALIESLEQLIAKKRQIKQGAMQELLTGKKRLPGFETKPGYKQTEVGVIPEDWSVKRLGKMGEALIGLTYSPANVQPDGLLVLRSSNIADGRLSFEDNVFVKIEVPNKIIVREGDILICVRNGSRDLIGKCAKIDKRAAGMTFGAFMAVFRTDFHDFVLQQFQSDVVERQIHAHLGATINQITNASLNSFRIPLPPTKAEQEAIATILSDMDDEITALEQKLTKARQLKQGMMQELLTGKTRLVDSGE
jgi:type I restriction enzyme S subunit